MVGVYADGGVGLVIYDVGLGTKDGSAVLGGEILQFHPVIACCKIRDNQVACAVGVNADEAVPTFGQLFGEADALSSQRFCLGTIHSAVVDDGGAIHYFPLREALALCGIHGVELRAVDTVVICLFAEGHLACATQGDDTDAIVDIGPRTVELHRLLAI